MMRPGANRLAAGLGLAALIVVADQITKWLALAALRPPGATDTPFAPIAPIHALPILDFALVWNRGVSFGVGNGESSWGNYIFAGASVAIAGVLIGWLARVRSNLLALALGAIVGGAVGNLIDRLRFGAVADFVYVHIGAFDWWPAFNLADTAISLGAAALAIDSLFGGRGWTKT